MVYRLSADIVTDRLHHDSITDLDKVVTAYLDKPLT